MTEDAPDTKLSYTELSVRSDQVATWLRGLGAGRGDHVLLMLGNQAPLGEVILAAMKLGAVIIPATTLLQPEDIADQLPRGAAFVHPGLARRHDPRQGHHGPRARLPAGARQIDPLGTAHC